MGKVWDCVADLFICLAVMLISATVYFGLRTETVMKSIHTQITEDFLAGVKASGIITVSDYENYIDMMGIGNSLPSISLEHWYKVYEPEYRFKTLEEVLEDINRAYDGSNDYHYREVITSRPHVDDPVNDGNLNKDTNESVLADALDTPADPNHVHGDDCYYGTRHIHTGNSVTGGGCYGIYQSHTHTDSCYTKTYCSGIWSGDWRYRYVFQTPPTCDNCKKNTNVYWSISGDTLSYTCYSCGHMGTKGYVSREVIDWYGICTGCGAAVSSSSSKQGNVHGEIKTLKCSLSGSYALSCGKIEGRYYDENGNEVSPICGQLAVILTPTHANQTVYINDPIITTARVVLMDGSEKTVVCGTDFQASSAVTNEPVILIYEYTIGGVKYSMTCVITVTVIPRSNTCQKGHTYNMNEDGADPGCPYCRAWIESLSVIYPTGIPIIITIGTTLAENNVTLLAVYMDGHTELVTNGYADNLDTGYLGAMDVTIGYKGVCITIPVTTVCASMTCSICGYEYSLYPDGTNPGCPRCISKIPVFTGNIMEYEHVNHTGEILKELYEAGKYDFNVNDEFRITVDGKSSAMAYRLLEKIYPAAESRFYIVKAIRVMTR